MSILVLERKNNEGVTLDLGNGERMHLTVKFKTPNQVALQFEAPFYVQINRDEIHEKKMKDGGINVSRKENSKMSRLGFTRIHGQGVTLTLDGNEEVHIKVNIKSKFQVGLAFEAPASIKINRDEIQQKIDLENQVEAKVYEKKAPTIVTKRRSRHPAMLRR